VLADKQKRQQVQAIHVFHEDSAKLCGARIWRIALVGALRCAPPPAKEEKIDFAET